MPSPKTVTPYRNEFHWPIHIYFISQIHMYIIVTATCIRRMHDLGKYFSLVSVSATPFHPEFQGLILNTDTPLM